MGRALQTPDDHLQYRDEEVSKLTYWTEASGRMLQDAIVQIVFRAMHLLHTDPDTVEATCAILRAGHKESKPGLFVFSPAVTADLVQLVNLDTTRVELIFDTAGAMLVKQTDASNPHMQKIAVDILEHANWISQISDGRCMEGQKESVELILQGRSKK